MCCWSRVEPGVERITEIELERAVRSATGSIIKVCDTTAAVKKKVNFKPAHNALHTRGFWHVHPTIIIPCTTMYHVQINYMNIYEGETSARREGGQTPWWQFVLRTDDQTKLCIGEVI